MRTNRFLLTIVLTVALPVIGFAQTGVKYPFVETTAAADGITIVVADTNGGVADAALDKRLGHQADRGETNKVSPKFVVQKADQSTSLAWSAAVTACSGKGGNWRLPTQRELMLIWTMGGGASDKYSADNPVVGNKALHTFAAGSFTPLAADRYWSSTPYTDGVSAWYVRFSDGTTNASTGNYYVRCVRDL